ncbi:UxaA family hydrolase [Georgenia yuyongxinii]|uniref:UxaA family hydrolase n=1 Tax=Georgenia yuyongxinii TaxID=2589797 RepID=UPI001CB6E28B|nr:UxaA family hydrolase [Georgenia yuyongxinii]
MIRQPDFLAHRRGDFVAVAVRDVEPGEATVGYLDETPSAQIDVTQPVPLGHKVALSHVAAEADVIEYGLRIGTASKDITKGDYVHIHNLRSARWQRSLA